MEASKAEFQFSHPCILPMSQSSSLASGQEGEVDAQLLKTHAESGNYFSVLPLCQLKLHPTQAHLGAAELEEDGHDGGVLQDRCSRQ
jgi:hypothetical protein